MMWQWFLVQVDSSSSASLYSDFALHILYYCVFLAKHPVDKKLGDEFSRWWTNWYQYSRDTVTISVVFGDIMLFRPNVTPNNGKYVQ